ncbi:MAG TPA: triple tyrosine motif-containing protein [Duganella sp.]|nr:triple tyrosine motif-containing protein [Duganella sp.]
MRASLRRVFICLCLATASAWGARPATDLLPFWHTAMHHTAWTKKDGAPANVLFMTQAADGMMLFGAYDGLHRFDGVKFERVDNIDGNKLLSTNVISLINFDGALWLTYQFGGISVFDKGKVKHYEAADGLPTGAIRYVDRSEKGVMWASSAYGMYWLDGARWRHAGEEQGLPAGEAKAMNFPADGGAITYIGDDVYRSPAGEPRFKRIFSLPGVEGGDDRPDGTIWMYSQKSGITAYDPDTGALSKVTVPRNDAGIFSYKSDKRGSFWLNTGKSIQLLDRDMKPVRSFTRVQGFTDDTFSNIFDDREGNLWFTTKFGIDRLRETKLTTVELPHQFNGPLVSPGADGRIWLSGAYSSETFSIAADGQRAPTGIKTALATLREPGGAMWFGTETHLWRRDGDQQRSWDLPAEMQGRRVQAMAWGQDGRLWLSMLGRGIHTFKDGVWTARGGVDDLGKDTAIWLFADPQGAIWFGYTKSRIAVLRDGKLTRYSKAEGLDIGNVLAIYSRSGRIWAGGEGGLAYLDGGRFVALTQAGGASFNGVSGIVETADGDLWLHHVDGIKRIAAAEIKAAVARGGRVNVSEEFNHLDGLDGLPSQIAPLPSLTQAPDGRIWYATNASVGWFNPAHLLKNTQAPNVMIKSILTDDKAYLPADERTLPHHTRALHIQFTATALSMPERVKFRYRLSGVDTQWRDAGLAREAFYTNLEPGNYQFDVIAANEDGVWNEKGDSIRFSIPPTFVQTGGFKLLCAVLLLIVLYLLYLWRMRALTARMQERMEERLDERERIARGLHDTFLQSLQGLILRVDGIRHRVKDDSESRAMVEKILDDADRLVAEGRSEVMGLRTSGSTDALPKAFAKVAESMKDQSTAAFSLRISGAPRLLCADVQDEVVFIGREALLNAFRHARASNIGMDIDYGKNGFAIIVRDDGVGMPAAADLPGAGQGHFGVTGMRERAQCIGAEFSLESAEGKGTTMRLALSASSAYHRPGGKGWFTRLARAVRSSRRLPQE